MSTHPYPTTGNPPGDPFCGGHAHDFDGGVIHAGGVPATCAPGQGTNKSAKLSPSSHAWSALGNLPEALYYPTLVSGWDKMFAFAGSFGTHSVYYKNFGATTWSDTGTDWLTPDTYPRVHLMPDWGFLVSSPLELFSLHTNWEYYPATNQWYQSGTDSVPGNDSREATEIYWRYHHSAVVGGFTPDANHYYISSAAVMIVGGLKAWVKNPFSGSTAWFDSGARPSDPVSWLPAPCPPHAPAALNQVRRWYVNATILPTGQLFVSGGTNLNGPNCEGVRDAEVYGIDLGTVVFPGWFAASPASNVRNYHSVALLLRDGRVWTAGGNADAAGSDCIGTTCDDGCGNGNGTPDTRQLKVQMFKPWYYGRSDRPVISSCPSTMSANGALQTINLSTTDATSITKVSLMRAGSVTHSFDTDQRLIALDNISAPTSKKVTFNAPYSSSVAPKGHYMLFVLSNKLGSPLLPSIGCWTTML
jgi:hypothetical protein